MRIDLSVKFTDHKLQIIKNLADNQVQNVRNFLETYAPNSTPQVVVKALDYISPTER